MSNSNTGQDFWHPDINFIGNSNFNGYSDPSAVGVACHGSGGGGSGGGGWVSDEKRRKSGEKVNIGENIEMNGSTDCN